MSKKTSVILLTLGICILLLSRLSFAQLNYESINYIGTGTSYYRTTGSYLNPFGIGSTIATGFELPWTSYNMSANQNISGSFPVQTYSENFSYSLQPKITSLTGNVDPYLEGVIFLKTFVHETAFMDRAFGNTVMYTEDGMPFYPVFSYYNENSSSRWILPAGNVSTSAQTTTFMGVPVASSYTYSSGGITGTNQFGNLLASSGLPVGAWTTGTGTIMSSWPSDSSGNNSNTSSN